jgi:acyl transferase domain-containing protein
VKIAEANPGDVAIVGLAGRFPFAKDVDEFWTNLCLGIEAVTFFSDAELLAAGVSPSVINDPNYVKAKAILQDVEHFDAAFFGMTAREAETTDPQHRLFLECSWEALENAGYDSETYNGSIGLYAGAGANGYLLNLYPSAEVFEGLGGFRALIGNEKDHLTTFASYKLNLKGPSITVQTSCSTSLVAVHLACQSLIGGECDMAIAGGVSIDVPQRAGQVYREGGIVSPDGHCRSFDARAEGTVGGSGVAVVVLKRLSDALQDRDNICAVIKGSAITNDGAAKVGYTAPSAEGQTRAIVEAQRVAGVDPGTITYIEAHGTGTALGDPIEVEALVKAFGPAIDVDLRCAIGSVKTNIGHLDTASGAAGLIKTALAVKHGLLPPSLHYEKPNPRINFAASRFYVNTRLAPWETHGIPRRAGVSSFGIGGTNAHVIVEQAPDPSPSRPGRELQILALSAKSSSALRSYVDNLTAHLRNNPEIDLADAAYTLHVGRRQFGHRLALLAANVEQALAALEKIEHGGATTQFHDLSHRPVVFMFPGQGTQYAGMGQELYSKESTFRAEIDRCFEILSRCGRSDLREAIFPSNCQLAGDQLELTNTGLAQVALFTVEYAMARLWMSWGIKPEAMIGHSIGEYCAACLAGVFSLEEGLELVVERARLMQQLPPGGMLSVGLSKDQVCDLLPPELSLAAVNGPELCVVSGPFEVLDQLSAALERKHQFCRLLRTSHAFHSRMVEPMLQSFGERLAKVKLNPPKIPFISNVTGSWISSEQARNPEYWVRHLRQTVQFLDGTRELLQEPSRIYLEVGPGRSLCALVGLLASQQGVPRTFASLRRARDSRSEIESMLEAVRGLWLAGAPVDWPAFYAGQNRSHIPMPTYPFERKRHWIDQESPNRDLAGGLSAQLQNEDSTSALVRELSSRPDRADELETVLFSQLRIMSEQLRLLSRQR